MRNAPQQIFMAAMSVAFVFLHGCKGPATTANSAPRKAAPAGSNMAYHHGAVAADHPLASEAGLDMLKRGGNAVDAAVATSFCLSVVRPYSCGIGGGGFMVIYVPATDGAEPKCVALNYRETCPAAIHRDFFSTLDEKNASRFGGNAVAVPGTVAGLAFALKSCGTLDLKTVLEPAIHAAENGFVADADFVQACRDLQKDIAALRGNVRLSSEYAKRMARRGGVQVGDIIRNPDQGRALRMLAHGGAAEFYEGELGQAVVNAVTSDGGRLSASDLRTFSLKESEPLRGRFRGNTVYSMPPPSSGGIAMQQIFGLLELHEADLAGVKPNSADYIHLVTECCKHAFADRSEWLADPAFVDVPVSRLTDPRYLDDLSRRIDMQHTLDNPFDYGSIVSAENPNPLNDHGTSHLCVIDDSGMAVACTETINLNFGSLVEVPGYGFFLNDEMDDFTTIAGEPNAFGLRQSEKNLPEPGKRPLSSMSPTIMVKDGRVVLIAGASGGPRIITGTMQAMLNCLLFDMSPDAAVAAPRFHHQWMPNVLQLEKGVAGKKVQDDLRARGHQLGAIDIVGEVQLISIGPDGIRAASDPRKGGVPAGY